MSRPGVRILKVSSQQKNHADSSTADGFDAAHYGIEERVLWGPGRGRASVDGMVWPSGLYLISKKIMLIAPLLMGWFLERESGSGAFWVHFVSCVSERCSVMGCFAVL